jgi:ABC-type Fe3+ transport system permease subunit
MKMDATQKQRIWKVAIGHFALSVLVFFALVVKQTPSFSGNDSEQFLQLQQYITWHNAWDFFWLMTLQLLQPQTLLIGKILKLCFGIDFFVKFFWLVTIIQICCAPIWSLCFGWLYVKFTNWLNHFPVLGKKVF